MTRVPCLTSLLLGCAILTGICVATAQPATAAMATMLDPSSYRASAGVVEAGVTAYNYAPTVMQDGVFRTWWCAGVAGDHILYAESSSLNGPFHARGSNAAYQDVFAPTGTRTFDGIHTCDPSVIRVNATYYMYYGGFDSSTNTTEIGVAQSSDGLTWARLNGGSPIVVPRNPSAGGYGAGQPSAAYVNGTFYLMYTDTTGLNGGLQYAISSAEPTFQNSVQTATATGFATRTPANSDAFVVSNSFSPDLQYSDALNAWIVLSNQSPGQTYVRFISPDFSHLIRSDLSIASTWVEGPGLVSRPDKHSLPPVGSDCSRIALDFINASGKTSAGSPTGLKHYGEDLRTDTVCGALKSGQVAAIYDGYAIEVPNLPLAFITHGQRLQSASFPPIQDVTKNFIVGTSDVFYDIGYGASLHVGAPVIGTTGQPGAFLLDNNTLWPVNSITLVTDNKSSITMVSPAAYASHPIGPPLYLVK
jgi:predicted GH43/DUF377 family glycosyl hydrolase